MEIFLSLCNAFLSIILNPIVIIFLIIVAIFWIKTVIDYKKSSYYKILKHPYLSVRYNIGRYGEYLTYKHLKNLEADGAKFLFNIYIPKENNETSEIDVLMICKKGIFVFESKNYSGWIFGSENQKNWYQTLPKGRGRSHKEQFYNPVMQNRSHIKHLKAFIGQEIPTKSIIVFSERCTLKNVQIKSDDLKVINRYDVASVVRNICNRISEDFLNVNDIAEIYNKLYPLTQLNEIAKLQHISNIKSNLNLQVNSKIVEEQQEETNIIDNSKETAFQSAKSVETPAAEAQDLKCPKCDGTLILRKATKGKNAGAQFYGCSNFPKCRYIQNTLHNEQ